MFATLSVLAWFAGTKTSRQLVRRFDARCEGIASVFVRRSAMTNVSEIDDRALPDTGIERSEIAAAVCGLVTIRDQGRRQWS